MLTHSFILDCFIIGLINGCGTQWLDLMMKRGHILDKIRYNAVRRAAKKAGTTFIDVIEEATGKPERLERTMIDEFDRQAAEGKDLPFGERIDYFNDLYWWVASKHKMLPAWLCAYCMSLRIFIVAYVALILIFSLSLRESLILFFIGTSANLMTITLFSRLGK